MGPGVEVVIVGLLGAVFGIAAGDGFDGVPGTPFIFAVTVNVYDCPAVKSDIVAKVFAVTIGIIAGVEPALLTV